MNLFSIQNIIELSLISYCSVRKTFKLKSQPGGFYLSQLKRQTHPPAVVLQHLHILFRKVRRCFRR